MTPSLTPQESQGLHWHLKENQVLVSGKKDVIAKVSAQLRHLNIPSSPQENTITISKEDFDKLQASNPGLSDSTRSQLVAGVPTSRIREPSTPVEFLKVNTHVEWIEGPRYGDSLVSPLMEDKKSGEAFLKLVKAHIDKNAELIESKQQPGSYRVWVHKKTVLAKMKEQALMGGFALDISSMFPKPTS